MLVEVSLEEGRAVVMEFAAGKPESPPAFLTGEFVEPVVLNELRSGGDGVFNQQIFPFAAVHAEAHSDDVPGVHIAFQRIESPGDLVVLLLGREPLGIAADSGSDL